MLKFIGDAMLATISFDERDEKAICRRALDAAVEASANLKIRNLEREAADLPVADVDIALHVGEVLYGNVGAVDRLDFTVIGPAVNEVVRMEKLCEPLGQQILFSSRFAEAAGRCDGRLESLGRFQLRGVDEAKEIFGLRLSQTPVGNAEKPDEIMVRSGAHRTPDLVGPHFEAEHGDPSQAVACLVRLVWTCSRPLSKALRVSEAS